MTTSLGSQESEADRLAAELLDQIPRHRSQAEGHPYFGRSLFVPVGDRIAVEKAHEAGDVEALRACVRFVGTHSLISVREAVEALADLGCRDAATEVTPAQVEACRVLSMALINAEGTVPRLTRDEQRVLNKHVLAHPEDAERDAEVIVEILRRGTPLSEVVALIEPVKSSHSSLWDGAL